MIKHGPKLIPVMQSCLQGVQLVHANAGMLARLSIVPFVATLVTLVAGRFVPDSAGLFWMPVLHLPSNYITGLLAAIILRFLLLDEFPAVGRDTATSHRNESITHGAAAYAVVSFFMAGLYLGVFTINNIVKQEPAQAAAYMPLAMALMVLLLFGARWLWLGVPLALGWPVRAFFARIGGWAGSLRVLAIFALCSIAINFVTSITRVLAHTLFGALSKGIATAADDVVLSIANVALVVFFTAASAAAVKAYMQEDRK